MSAVPGDADDDVAELPHRATTRPDLKDAGEAKEIRRQTRQREREERIHGKLTDLCFSDISCTRNGRVDFLKAHVLVCIRGSRSQFDPRVGKAKSLLPPLTVDCCQTFSTLSAVLLSSLGFAVMLAECFTTSTINYLLYISAWMHQLTLPCWPSRGGRPTLRDLNICLHLGDFFPAKVCDNEFDVVFYNQAFKALDLLRNMCVPVGKRPRGEADSPCSGVCGYVIVSGAYTVSIFSVDHDIKKRQSSRYTQAWSFYICDSHATQPWSQGKASVTGLTFGVPSSISDGMGATQASDGSPNAVPLVCVDDGLHYFSTVLFTLLEEHRRGAAVAPSQVPYMTWTPIRRKRALSFVAEELKDVIDRRWLPKVLQTPAVHSEAAKFGFRPLECFLGINTATNTPTTAEPKPES